MANLLSTTLSGNNHITFGPNSTWSSYLRVGGNGHSVSSNEYASVVTTNGNLHLDAGTSRATYINYYAGTAGVAFGNGASSVVAWMGADGDLWKGGSDNSGTQYVYNSGTWGINITGNSATTSQTNFSDLSITGSAHKYLTINPGNGYEAMVRYIGGSGSSWYVGKRTSSQLIGTESFHFYSEAAGATVGGINPSGDMIVTGSMRAPIFYDSINTAYYLDPNSSTSGYFAGTLRQNDGKYVRDSSYRTISGYSDYYSGGDAGWYRVAEITLTSNCSGAVLYGTLYDHRYDGADAYQISIVARAECNFTSNNDSHYINVGCTILGSTAFSSYQSKIRVLLVASSSGSRTYEVQFYETNWNHDTWQLETTGWTVYSSPQAPRSSTGTAMVNYVSNQNADFQRANAATYSPIYYDSQNTAYYVDPNSTSYLYHLVLSGNSYFRPNTWIQFDGNYGVYWPNHYGLHLYPNNDGSYGSLQVKGSKNSWHGIHFDSGSTLMMNSGETGVHRQGVGWQWRWYNGEMYISAGSTGGGTERTVIHSGNIGSQSVNYASSAGNADTTDGLHVHGGRNNEANKIVRTDGDGYIQAGWINSDSGNMGFGNRIARIQCSDDNYIRFQTLSEFKVSIGLSGKNVYSRRIDYTTDANYHVGSFGAQGVGTEEVFHYGSGFFDVWAGGGTFPSGMSHIHGINMLHYTVGNGGNAYGWQMASQYNKPGEYFARNVSGGSFSSWSQFITSNNIGSQSVNYASSAGDANTLDSLDSSEFARGRASYQVLNLDTIKQPGLYQYDGGIGGTQPEGADQANLRTIEIGSGGRYSQMAFDWNSEQAWFRRQTGSTWSAWREFIHSGNIASQSVSYADESGFAASAGSVEWTSVQNKPATFSPSSHTHAISDVTGLQTALDGKQASGSYAAASHTHAIADVTGLQAALDGKQAAGSYAAASHTHTFASLTSKPTTISGYGITDAITTGNIGSQSVSSASGVSITGFGDNSFTYHQTPGNVHGWTGGWASHFIGNHGNGDTYYSQSIIMPFWGVPRYQRNEGGNKVGPWQFITEENIAAQSVSFATTSGSATSATTANRLERYGIIYGNDWNSYYQNNRLLAISAHGHSGSNRPSTAYTYGSGLSYYNSGADHYQFFFPENGGSSNAINYKIHYRSGWNGNWGGWRQLLDMAGNVAYIAGNQGTGIEVSSGVGYNQSPNTFLHLKGQGDYGAWRSLYIDLVGDASGQDIAFSRIQEGTNTKHKLWYIPKNQDLVIFEYQIQQNSDSRKKDNVSTITNAVDKVKQLRGVEFDWNSGAYEGKHDIGVIAQDVEAVLPEAVSTQEDGYKTVSYTKLIPLLIETVKEQQAMIEQLSARLSALEQK